MIIDLSFNTDLTKDMVIILEREWGGGDVKISIYFLYQNCKDKNLFL